MTWIMIIKDVPVQEQYRPDLLGIYYGIVSKWLFVGELELSSSPFHGGGIHNDDSVIEFKSIYSKSRYSRKKVLCTGKDQAMYFLDLFNSDDKESIPPDVLDEFNRLDRAYGLPEIEPQYKILTTGGDVCIQPHEYSVVGDRLHEYKKYIGHEYQLHFFGEDEDNQSFVDKMFYLKTRGVPQVDCVGMLLGEITRQDVCYMKPHAELPKAMGIV